MLFVPCFFFSTVINAQQILASTGTVLENITYATFSKTKVQLDLYQPQTKGIHPAIVLVHGGGWVNGSRKGFHQMALSLAERGYVVANIDYRLATQAQFPAAVQDTKAAVRWLRQHAKLYNIDPGKIAGIGGSAGGHLIAMAALTGHSKKFSDDYNYPEISSELQAVILMGAGVDQVTRAENAKNQYVKNCVIFFAGSLKDKREVYIQGSPITHISANAPPILMVDGGQDNPGARYVDFIPKLQRFGIEYQFKVIADAKHGQWLKEKYLHSYVNTFDTFLQAHLH